MSLLKFLFGRRSTSSGEAVKDRQENTITKACGDFATRLYDKLAGSQPGKNLFLSPFSVQVALAMCAAGAKGKTRQELADLIGAPDNVAEQNRRYAELIKSIHREGKQPFELTIANALWGQQGYHFNPEYLKAIADFYQGAFNEVDFAGSPDRAVRTINDWVSEKTHEKIKDLLNQNSITKDTGLILTNAIYFKGLWAKEFKKSWTVNEDWYGPNATRQVPTMHGTDSYYYFENQELQALDLTYKGGQLALLAVLPKAKNGLLSLEAEWTKGDLYEKVTTGLRYEETVAVSLPRFKMEAAFALKPVLSDMGCARAFSHDADFSGIGKEPLEISEVVHKAYVEVNEEGTEAAAVTAIGYTAICALPDSPPEPKVFKADHPFLFFIRDRFTNTLLFSGRLIEP